MWQALGSSGAAGGAASSGAGSSMMGNIMSLAQMTGPSQTQQNGLGPMDMGSTNQMITNLRNRASMPGANYLQGLPTVNQGGRALS